MNELEGWEEAADLLAGGEAAARRTWTGANAKWFGSYLSKLGRARAGLRDYPGAEPAQLEAHALLAEGFGDDHARTVETVETLARLYEAWHGEEPNAGHDRKAGEWRTRVP